ncbi:hypothetical protein HK100_009236 [Physocladia obscura]|uniref:Uncharacterized protein n=1 Tax=Physocladia obscura TaxID=109957 RepID=A0AAD5XKY7_9FUNG|nr:hypothetical protein HK100_009236 [Physocladia obscura]
MTFTLKLNPAAKKYKGQHANASATVTVEDDTAENVIAKIWTIYALIQDDYLTKPVNSVGQFLK